VVEIFRRAPMIRPSRTKEQNDACFHVVLVWREIFPCDFLPGCLSCHVDDQCGTDKGREGDLVDGFTVFEKTEAIEWQEKPGSPGYACMPGLNLWARSMKDWLSM
jgi:hypothetical protein